MDYEKLLELVKSRRSVRKFTARQIKRDQVEKLLQAACWAPSNHNRQGWKFVVFENHQTIRTLADQARKSVKNSVARAHRLAAGHADELIHFAGAFDQAPLVILAMHKKSPAVAESLLLSATGELASGEALSTAMACQNLLLAAHAIGLGACVMTAPLLAGQLWNSLADLPAGFTPTCLIALGYPACVPAAPRRKKLEHVIEYK